MCRNEQAMGTTAAARAVSISTQACMSRWRSVATSAGLPILYGYPRPITGALPAGTCPCIDRHTTVAYSPVADAMIEIAFQ